VVNVECGSTKTMPAMMFSILVKAKKNNSKRYLTFFTISQMLTPHLPFSWKEWSNYRRNTRQSNRIHNTSKRKK